MFVLNSFELFMVYSDDINWFNMVQTLHNATKWVNMVKKVTQNRSKWSKTTCYLLYLFFGLGSGGVKMQGGGFYAVLTI